MQDAATPGELTGLQGVGPCNPECNQGDAGQSHAASIRPSRRTAPQLVTVDSAWWADNYDLAMKRFQDLLNQPRLDHPLRANFPAASHSRDWPSGKAFRYQYR